MKNYYYIALFLFIITNDYNKTETYLFSAVIFYARFLITIKTLSYIFFEKWTQKVTLPQNPIKLL